MSTAAVDQVLALAVAAGDVPNATAVAADRDGVIYEGSAGPRAVGQDDPVGPDSMFRIASQTKMVVTVAALQQVERGNLELDAPVDTYLPEFADLRVLEGFDGDTPKLRPAGARATVRHLVTHTTGLGYDFFSADVRRWQEVTGTRGVNSGSMEVFTAPLTCDPGTRFEYGINSDWLGRVVEAASGQSLDAYLDVNVLGPLGMHNTTFLMTEEQRANSVPVHMRGEDGAWQATGVDWSQSPQWWAGGHGLYATPRDYLAFQRMLLGGGTLGDARILEPATVAAAFTNQIGSLDFPASIPTADPVTTCEVNLGPGLKWGYGLLLNTERAPGMRAAGSGAWAGIFNTHYWVDPTSGITAAIYTQTLPFVDPGALRMYLDFERALYASL
ncbi:serine hydrolase domain-containing protein [Pseudonocardia acaciae]|uniref:serine hydrolase domain-containing protein n=1 Tax=Pseudonocardia acaciae TaxID=551276 RepID=UPI000491AAFE|nr:serine hydrolase domain-containing protein [Pseudonocardia acaciae]